MMSRKVLVYASTAFAVLWTAGMMWWGSPLNIAEAMILMVCGILAGIGWYFGMRMWLKWSGRLSG